MVVGGGGEGSLGVYISISRAGLDIGVFGSGGAGAGANVGLSGYGAYIPGGRENISGTTINTNVSTAIASGTYMEDVNTGDFAGIAFGPAARLGGSETYSKTGAYGLRDAFESLFEWWGNRNAPKGSCP